MKTAMKILLPIVIIAISIAGAMWMISTAKTADKTVQGDVSTLVETMTTELTSRQLTISATGVVTPSRRIVVVPEVAGKLIEVAPALVPGGHFSRGDLIARIDPRDYEIGVKQAEDLVANARFQLQLEQGQQAVAAQEWALLEDSVPTTEQGKNLALRKPHLEKAQTNLESAMSSLDKAKLNLERTTIRAPFNVLVLQENVDLGQVVGAQTQIATLVGTDSYWIQASISIEDLQYITFPKGNTRGSAVTIINKSGGASSTFTGTVFRLVGDLDQVGRLARVLISVDDPLRLRSKEQDMIPLLLGSYVEVLIQGPVMEDIIVLPRYALRDGDDIVAGSDVDYAWIWIMDAEDKLEVRKIQIIWRFKDEVIVNGGLKPGERIITSTIAAPIESMKLRTE